jgi:putative ABC transport system substrate-binding protein
MDAVIVLPDALFWTHRAEIVKLAQRHRLPDVHAFKALAELGGLLSYATDLVELSRRATTYVDRILKGAKPGDLPFEQPTKFDLVVNAATARMLGLTLPPSVLLRATHVVE